MKNITVNVFSAVLISMSGKIDNRKRIMMDYIILSGPSSIILFRLCWARLFLSR